MSEEKDTLINWHQLDLSEVTQKLQSFARGLASEEARRRSRPPDL